jgi:hypothetical protein
MGRKRDALKLQTQQRAPKRKTKSLKRQADPEPFGYGAKGTIKLVLPEKVTRFNIVRLKWKNSRTESVRPK